jgi:hypothetical protein
MTENDGGVNLIRTYCKHILNSIQLLYANKIKLFLKKGKNRVQCVFEPC